MPTKSAIAGRVRIEEQGDGAVGYSAERGVNLCAEDGLANSSRDDAEHEEAEGTPRCPSQRPGEVRNVAHLMSSSCSRVACLLPNRAVEGLCRH